MRFIVNPSALRGSIDIPGSKSHTIRALAFALLADGTSRIEKPLDSSDTRSCLAMVRGFGGEVTEAGECWTVRGSGGYIPAPDNIIDVGNSGTTLYIGIGIATLIDGITVLTGDGQIRNRPAQGLLDAVTGLGASARSTRGNGKPPVVVEGKLSGGSTAIEAVTSQYLTSLLIAAPLAPHDSLIDVPLLNEAPYVDMTLRWLDTLGIGYTRDGYRKFFMKGGQRYRAFGTAIAADFSSATFFLVAAAVTGSEITLQGLDFDDPQGDKAVVSILKDMGATVDIADRSLSIRGGELRGGTFDLNAIPDALPALAVAGCFAKGETRLVNVPQARLKETDRIAVMREELAKMGADIEERPDGLIIRPSRLRGARVSGHDDHRVVMALAVAGLACDGETRIDTAESVSVTFPGFMGLLRSLGGSIQLKEE